MSPSTEAVVLERLTEIATGVGELRALVPRVGALEDRLDELAARAHDQEVTGVRAQLATYQAREAASAAWRRDLGKGVVIALLSAALGVLGAAAAKATPRATTSYQGAGGAAAPVAK